MEHYRLRKYRGPEVWSRARTAYEEGQTGPDVARRHDVGLANLRKKAREEGWSRKHQAAAAERAVVEALARPDTPPPEAAPEAPTRPAVAVAAAVARASAALAAGRAAEAAGLLRAAETLARVADVDSAATSSPDPATLTPEQDAAREAEAKKDWDDMLDLIEAQADALARHILADRPHAPAMHSGFVNAWRAQYLGPEVAAHDRADMQARSAHKVKFHWHDDGRPRPVDEVRAMYYRVFRRQIRSRAGLPAVAPGEEAEAGDWG